ncbi:MAG: hypothetical protein AB7O97_09040 [Planctomycetota bacterium]
MNGYRPQSDDTHPDLDRMTFDRLAAMTPEQRLQVCAELCRAAERVSVAGLRLRYPQADEHELQMRAAALRLGRETMVRFFGARANTWLP